jgi:hypothetical protein
MRRVAARTTTEPISVPVFAGGQAHVDIDLKEKVASCPGTIHGPVTNVRLVPVKQST